MNKKTVALLGGAAGLIFTLSACSGSTYEYQVSGSVVDQQIDYKCPKKTLSMDAVAFTTGKHKSTSSSSKKSSSSSSKKTAKPKGKTASPKSKTVTPGRTGGGTSHSTSTATPTPKPKTLQNRGVTLSSKPDSPERLRKLPKVTYGYHGCKVDDYEIFVVDRKGDLYEQDVRKSDYNNCARAGFPKGKKYKLFPLCTKG